MCESLLESCERGNGGESTGAGAPGQETTTTAAAAAGCAVSSPSGPERTNDAGGGDANLFPEEKTKQEAGTFLTAGGDDCAAQAAAPCDSWLSRAVRDPQDPCVNCGVRARVHDCGEWDGFTSTSRCVWTWQMLWPVRYSRFVQFQPVCGTETICTIWFVLRRFCICDAGRTIWRFEPARNRL